MLVMLLLLLSTSVRYLLCLQLLTATFVFLCCVLLCAMTLPNPSLLSSGGDIKFTSFNCKGLNNPIKRSKVLHHLRHLSAHVIFLQETHLKASDNLKLKRGWVGQTYHSSFPGKSRGVAILFHKSVPFVQSNVISDPNGRFIIVSGQIHNIRVILANVYAPNSDDDAFFRRLFSTLPDMSSHYLIMGGDFNCWLDPQLDRSSSKVPMPSKSAKVIQSFMKEFSVSEVWRYFNPSKREYSFFSHVHHTFTRIDFFFVDDRLLPSISACKYDAIVLSDHAPISMNVYFKNRPTARTPWRLNTRLLLNEDFVNFVSQQIDFFVSTNKTPDVSFAVLWETLKAYIRGEIISYTGYERKRRKEKLIELSQRISQLDNIYATSKSSDVFKERLSLQMEYDVLMTHRTTELLLQSRSRFYEHGDKASKLLAHQLRRISASRQIPQIQTNTGSTTDLDKINKEFKVFYESLYSSDQASTPDFNSFFNNLDFPSIERSAKEELEKPITIAELFTALNTLQGGKCPGPDGYPAEFYKKFWHKLAPLLLDMFNESFEFGRLPQTLNQASISLLLKEGKDPLACASYRPISLLNVDFKLLSKLLALRLDSILPSVISSDQTGFIRNRHSFSNLRRLFNTIYNVSTSKTQEALISLDAEKAFDRVEWNYLFFTLEKFGFGNQFISWVKLLYASPQASIRTNDVQSDYFHLHRSTRQGCPLSPLLFAIAIEPLAIKLHSHPNISGILRNNMELKVSLYADDLLLYVSDLPISVPAVLTTLKAFGQISGYKLNLNKSEIFPINIAAKNYPLHNFPFKTAQNSFKYLGVHVTYKFQDLFKANFAPLLTRIKEDFDRWSTLNLSLIARVNSVKMNVLPRFSYLFQCVPFYLPQSFFHKVDSLISEFVWNKKVPRLRRQYLQRPKPLGGLALPNLRFYYWAANIRVCKYWLQYEAFDSPPTWLLMEVNSVKPVSLSALVYSPIQSSTSPYTKNRIVKTSLRIWVQFRRYFGLQSFSAYAPLAANHAFPPSLVDGAFVRWSILGIKNFKDLYIDNVFASFQQLTDKFSLPKEHFFSFCRSAALPVIHFPCFPEHLMTQLWMSFLHLSQL